MRTLPTLVLLIAIMLCAAPFPGRTCDTGNNAGNESPADNGGEPPGHQDSGGGDGHHHGHMRPRPVELPGNGHPMRALHDLLNKGNADPGPHVRHHIMDPRDPGMREHLDRYNAAFHTEYEMRDMERALPLPSPATVRDYGSWTDFVDHGATPTERMQREHLVLDQLNSYHAANIAAGDHGTGNGGTGAPGMDWGTGVVHEMAGGPDSGGPAGIGETFVAAIAVPGRGVAPGNAPPTFNFTARELTGSILGMHGLDAGNPQRDAVQEALQSSRGDMAAEKNRAAARGRVNIPPQHAVSGMRVVEH